MKSKTLWAIQWQSISDRWGWETTAVYLSEVEARKDWEATVAELSAKPRQFAVCHFRLVTVEGRGACDTAMGIDGDPVRDVVEEWQV